MLGTDLFLNNVMLNSLFNYGFYSAFLQLIVQGYLTVTSGG